MPLATEYILKICYIHDPAGEEPDNPGWHSVYQEKRLAYSTSPEAVVAAAHLLLHGVWDMSFLIPPHRIVHIELCKGYEVEAENQLAREELLQ